MIALVRAVLALRIVQLPVEEAWVVLPLGMASVLGEARFRVDPSSLFGCGAQKKKLYSKFAGGVM